MTPRLSMLWPTLAAAILFVTTLALGQWQLDRAHVKEAAIARYDRAMADAPIEIGTAPIDAGAPDAAATQTRRVHARGTWLADFAVFLDNQVYGGQPGYRVYMPLRLAGGDTSVLVDRGWVAAGSDRRRLPAIVTPRGTVDIIGMTATSSPRFKELSPVYREGRIWENITVERFSDWSRLRLHPFIVRQTSDSKDGLKRVTPAPDSGADRNRGYALQWFVFAALTAILWTYYFFRGRHHDK